MWTISKLGLVWRRMSLAIDKSPKLYKWISTLFYFSGHTAWQMTAHLMLFYRSESTRLRCFAVKGAKAARFPRSFLYPSVSLRLWKTTPFFLVCVFCCHLC